MCSNKYITERKINKHLTAVEKGKISILLKQKKSTNEKSIRRYKEKQRMKEDKSSESVIEGLKGLKKRIGKKAIKQFKTITTDNGFRVYECRRDRRSFRSNNVLCT